jgi:hypothetical protein
MKGRRFSEEQIIGILRRPRRAQSRQRYVGGTGSRRRPSTSGKRSTAGWRYRRRAG